MTMDYTKVLLIGVLCTCFAGLFQVQACGKDQRAAVLRAGSADGLDEALGKTVESAGYLVDFVDFDGLCDPSLINAETLDLLVLTDGSSLPSASGEVIETYLRGGGNIIALNTPLWQKSLLRLGSRWVEREQYERDTASTLPENVLFDFASANLDEWERSTDHPQNATSHTASTDGPDGTAALHTIVSDQQGWDTFRSPQLDDPFPEGHLLTVFAAKGDETTRMLSVEWIEEDGSRWIAVVNLSTEWKRYVLQPSDFKYWHSTPGRGGPNDCFQPRNAQRLSIGLAFSHTGRFPGRHEYWVGTIGTAAGNPEYAEYLASHSTPVLDTLSPGYKFFHITNASGLQVRQDQLLRALGSLPMPDAMRSPHPRPRGAGFAKGALWRWIPLMDAVTSTGEWCGSPASLYLNLDGEYKGSAWASFGVEGSDWYTTQAALGIIEEVARRMREGVYLVGGGTNYYTYFDGQNIRLGFEAINIGDQPVEDIVARVRILDATTGSECIQLHCDFDLSPSERKSEADEWLPESWPKDGYTAVVELERDGQVIDRVWHEVRLWQPKKAPEFVTVQDGDFVLGGRRWRPHGINYMPSSGIASQDRDYFEHWLGARAYDPEVIQRDLDHIKDIGFNAVSIFIDNRVMEDQNLLDLLRRLGEMGLKANLSLRPGTPMDFDHQWPLIKPIIEHYRLRDNDTIFAYDLAWEPMFNKHEDRRKWDRDWEAWIEERYGSVKNAEDDWGFAVPSGTTGEITNPSQEQMENDGEWRRMVAAYRRFLDTLLYEKYGAARRAVREVDPNHLVSFRMSNAGDPTFQWEGRVPYDWPYLAAAVDILEPEAYGRIGDWERVKPGWFTFEYARLCAPDKPMIWSEMGVSTWEMDRMESSSRQQEFQAQYYRDFYRMMIGSGADGVFFWWYPGGFRVYEDSDYGIVNPDGSDRPVTEVIRELGHQLISGPDAKPIDHWIEVDRDSHPHGLVGIYDAVKDDFWNAIEERKVPGLRTSGTGTTSADCPLLAVGNTPCNGDNPPKYLDAYFDTVEVEYASGDWRPMDSRTISGSSGPTKLRLTLTNLGEATLLSSAEHRGRGTVYVVARCGNALVRAPLPEDVARHESAVVEISLPTQRWESGGCIVVCLESLGRTRFGHVLTFDLTNTECVRKRVCWGNW